MPLGEGSPYERGGERGQRWQTTASYILTGLLLTVDSWCDVTSLVQCWWTLFVYICMFCKMFDDFCALCLPL